MVQLLNKNFLEKSDSKAEAAKKRADRDQETQKE
jgi:hypothetical protein